MQDKNISRIYEPFESIFSRTQVLVAWLKGQRIREGLWKVPTSSPNGEKKLPIKKNKKNILYTNGISPNLVHKWDFS